MFMNKLFGYQRPPTDREIIYHLAIAQLVIAVCEFVGNFISSHVAG